MKYIKTYEKYDKPENEYWKINTNNPWYEITKEDIEKWKLKNDVKKFNL